jgi:hypothetical protein
VKLTDDCIARPTLRRRNIRERRRDLGECNDS